MNCVLEHNGNDSLLYAVDFVGAYTRGATPDEALSKMYGEVLSYCAWARIPFEDSETVTVIQKKQSTLQIADADSDVLFESEKAPLTESEYIRLKHLALRSASDFQKLYESVKDKHHSSLPSRSCFYGKLPRTAQEMYEHTKSVNAYYFGEIGVDCDNEGDILSCRERGFALLEKTPDYLQNPVIDGSYGELWSLRKMLRRFIWHDRIHARAMYRMALKTFGENGVKNVFHFTER